MALKGNLRDFSVTQLLNLINLARKTGTLIVEGISSKVWVSFREGRLAFAQDGQQDNSLAAILFQANKITAAQYRVIKQRAGNMSDKELGLLLINANYITQQDILSSLQVHFLGVVNNLFTWNEGVFRFESNILPPEEKITIRLPLENIIIEGSRRLQEQEQLQDEIPSLDMALRFAERPGTNIRNVNLSAQEWKVVSYINPKNTIRQIARANKLNDLEIRRVVYSLLQAGLVEIVRPSWSPSPAVHIPAKIQPVKSNRDEQKSLINRLIDRIRSL